MENRILRKTSFISTRKAAVIGAGTVGSSVAYALALRDIAREIVLIDIDQQKCAGEAEDIRHGIASMGTADLYAGSYADCADCDLIIESSTENMDKKKELFSELDKVCKDDAILATNTSALSITEIAAVTSRPAQVIGMHFMNPVPVMKLVEVIRGLATSDETYQIIKEESEALGKVPVEVKDVPGFVSNRVLQIMINEAIYELYEGVATVEDIDNVMKLGMNHPMGPLQLADFIGLDTVLAIMNVMYEGYGDCKYRPCPLIRQYVKAGWLGKKSGRGFYKYA